MKKYIIILLICLAFSANVFAAETESAPRLLPGNPFYFLKEWNRSIQMVLTFNETKKIELEEKFSSDRLKEIEVLVKKNTKQEVIERATEKYEKSMQKISERLEKVKEKAENNPALQNFVERFTEKREYIEEKLENLVPQKVMERIRENNQAVEQKLGKIRECPQVTPPASDFCLSGTIKEKQDKMGCAISFVCQRDLDDAVCTQENDPVCGKDGKQYNNPCYARKAGAEVDYKGNCEMNANQGETQNKEQEMNAGNINNKGKLKVEVSD